MSAKSVLSKFIADLSKAWRASTTLRPVTSALLAATVIIIISIEVVENLSRTALERPETVGGFLLLLFAVIGAWISGVHIKHVLKNDLGTQEAKANLWKGIGAIYAFVAVATTVTAGVMSDPHSDIVPGMIWLFGCGWMIGATLRGKLPLKVRRTAAR